MRVETCQFGSTELAQALEIGQIDFAIGYLPLLDELFLSVNASSHSMVRLPLPHLISYLIRIPYYFTRKAVCNRHLDKAPQSGRQFRESIPLLAQCIDSRCGKAPGKRNSELCV